ncbi:MAG: hypothetical protein K2M53_03350 [Muribaculaceae bacterium]|nr:hypothetical protein [Muribaculaceae bacterium]
MLKDKYGSVLFTEDRFWGILTDFYNFNGESTLKDTAKECIRKGYIKDLASVNDSKFEIKRILEYYDSESVGKREAVASVLFSVGIALNKASLEDFESCLCKINENTKENIPDNDYKTQDDNIAPADDDDSDSYTVPTGDPSDKLPFKYILYLLLGLLILLGSIYFYSAYLYHDFPIGLIILCEAIAQLFYTSYSMRIVDNQGNLSAFQRIKFASLIIPILLCFLILYFTPLVFMVDDFKEALYIAFSGDIGYYNILSETNPGGIQVAFPKSPGIFTFLGTALFLFTEYSCISGLVKLKRKYAGKISHSYTSLSWLSFAVILITLGTCLGIHIHKCGENRKEYLIENRITLKNSEQRAQKVKTLSFKGIELGARIDNISAISLTEQGGNAPEIEPLSTDSVLITMKSSQDIVTDLFNHTSFLLLKMEDKILKDEGYSPAERGFGISETSYNFGSNFFNNDIIMEVIGNQGKVGSIIISPDNEDEIHATFKNFKEIYDLYVKKYGKPTRGWRSEKYVWFDHDDLEGRLYYSWKFKNCEIQLSKYNIIYIDLEFVERLSSLIDDHNSMVNEKIRAQDDSIAREKHRADSIKQAEIREDSLRKLKHQRNAINEI